MRVREGGSGSEGYERGIHRESSGYAGRRQRARAWGGEHPKFGRDNNRVGVRHGSSNFEMSVFTIFVDNLPTQVFKGDLYREFAKDRRVKDAFISRKQRKNERGPFAFVRFEDIGGARRVVDRLNGYYCRGRNLMITLCKYRRKRPSNTGFERGAWFRRIADSANPRERGGRMKHVWKEVKRNKVATRGVDNVENCQQAKLIEGGRKKEVIAKTCESKQDLLSRSMMGVSLKPIKLKEVQWQIGESWEGTGHVECRDVGPFRCLLTFESANVRDKAMSNPGLLAIFDELRPHWNYISSHSRRIWLEVLGLPIQVRSGDTFNNIAKLWGKMVLMDDRTEHYWSFSVVRFLVDCYEWETISEWITIKVEDREFNIYVREFGGEAYNFQSHTNIMGTIIVK
ncbi:hypothetical protein PIB30_008435 [Stylosanthes scabra]|uniref:RRM domain-containing protein n=1 Tax=Stylosanthes scabra TaxID=79078 RepID=A0ABU6W2Y3_9FABA|nr:hypothetical protein [Stylosanthes scabra]